MNMTEGMQRIRLLRIWEILSRETDEEHPMSTEELRARLRGLGIETHRTTVYEDIKLLNAAGYEILSRRGRSNRYFVMDRSFSDPEIHILLDAVQAASFITEKKTAELVDKIAMLAGSRKGEVLKKNIVRFNTAKSTNESIYYTVNEIVTAICNRKRIIFLYFDYDLHHNRVYRRDGHHYVVSPFATVFDDGHYYLVVYDERYGRMTNYRIDRMEHVEIIDEPATLPPSSLAFDIASYKRSLFGMFAGETTDVTLRIHRSLIDTVYDLFGEGVCFLSDGEDTVRFTATVQLSDLFLGWCCSFGDKLQLIAPREVTRHLRAYIDAISGVYAVKKENEEKGKSVTP